jgi:hypothetical protein
MGKGFLVKDLEQPQSHQCEKKILADVVQDIET